MITLSRYAASQIALTYHSDYILTKPVVIETLARTLKEILKEE
ncbi:hypothetical protein MASR2M15_05360 [Anaerolineales bacterium]